MTDWRLLASCRGMDPEAFFPERGDREGVAAALETCSRCSVTAECLDYALSLFPMPRDGIWGGLSISQIRNRRIA